MRIVIASHVNSQSGRSRAFVALHDLLTDLGHRVTVLAPDHRSTAPLYPSRHPVAIESVPGVRGDYTAKESSARTTASPSTDLRGAEALRSRLSQLAPEIVITPATVSCGLLDLVREATDAAIVLSDHTAHRLLQSWEEVSGDERYVGLLARSDWVHGVNPGLVEIATRLSTTPATFVPNPVTDSPARRRLVWNQLAPRRRLLSVGRLVEHKGHGDVVAAFATIAGRFPGWRLDVYGDGPDHEALAQLIARSGCPQRIALRGFDPSVTRRYPRYGVYVSASRAEACSVALQEAMAAGCVPVVLHGSGSDHLIDNGVSGQVVDGRDPQQGLAETLASLLHTAERRPVAYARMRRAAATRARAWTERRVRGRWQELLQQVAGERAVEAQGRADPGGGGSVSGRYSS